MRISDWSSDVCSSDLALLHIDQRVAARLGEADPYLASAALGMEYGAAATAIGRQQRRANVAFQPLRGERTLDPFHTVARIGDVIEVLELATATTRIVFAWRRQVVRAGKPVAGGGEHVAGRGKRERESTRTNSSNTWA